MGQRHERRRVLGAAAIAGLATALFCGWMVWDIGGKTVVTYVDDLGTTLAALLATGLSLRAGARQIGRLRRFWWLLAGACASWTVGEAIWAVYDLVLGREVPVPSWADVGYLAAIPLAVAALVCHPAMRGGGARRARSVFDGLLAAMALLFLSWTFVLGPLWKSTDLTTAGGLVALAYPFGDVVIVFFIVLAARGTVADGRLALWWLLGGLLIMALADSTYTYLTGVKSYETGNLLDGGWMAAYLAIAVGAFCSDARGAVTRTAEAPSPGLGLMLAPFLPMFIALSVLGIETQLGHRPGPVAAIMAFALVLLVLARQALLVFDLLTGEEREGSVAARLYAALLEAMPDHAPDAAPRSDRAQL